MTQAHTPGGTFELNGLHFSDDQQNSISCGVDEYPVYAAAPDMLDALKSALDDLMTVEGKTAETIRAYLRDTIAKATGAA